MRRLIDSARARLVATLLCSAMAAPMSGCVGGTAAPASPTPAAPPDGASLFRGIFFGDGPAVASLPPEFQVDRATMAAQMRQRMIDDPKAAADQIDSASSWLDRNGASKDVLQRLGSVAADLRAGKVDEAAQMPSMQPMFYDAITARMRALDAGFFDRFGRDMTSGDPVRVESALTDGVKQLSAAVKAYRDTAQKAQDERIPLGLPVDTINWIDQAFAFINVGVNVFQVAVDVEAVAVVAAVVVVVLVLPAADAQGASLQHDQLVGTLTRTLATRS